MCDKSEVRSCTFLLCLSTCHSLLPDKPKLRYNRSHRKQIVFVPVIYVLSGFYAFESQYLDLDSIFESRDT